VRGLTYANKLMVFVEDATTGAAFKCTGTVLRKVPPRQIVTQELPLKVTVSIARRPA